MAFAAAGLGFALRAPAARATAWFCVGIAAQAAALYLLARDRGAETPYMAMKMLYLALYAAVVFAAVTVARLIDELPRRACHPTGWLTAGLVLAGAVRLVWGLPVAPPIVSVDLHAAGQWARSTLPPACVEYVVPNAETAYWLHLAVMGEPRSSARTAELDHYTANEIIERFGTAVVIARPPREGDPDCRRRPVR